MVATAAELPLGDPTQPGWKRAPKAALKRARENRVELPEAASDWEAHVFRYIATLNEFCMDDLWDVVAKPPEPRAAGAAITKLARAGVIKKTKKTVASRRRHGTKLPVWRVVR